MVDATETIHIWEARGLGQAPFRLVDMISLPSTSLAEHNPEGYNNAAREAGERARAHGVSCGSCDVCGTGIVYNFVIRSADNRRFVVGSDCVAKTGDQGLVRAVDLLVKEKKAVQREADRLEKWERDRPAREARQAAFQEEQDRLERERQAAASVATAANQWLLDVLESVPSGDGTFVPDMVESLRRSPLSDLSDRCVMVLARIYAKAKGGRSNSKAYKAAEGEFWDRFNG